MNPLPTGRYRSSAVSHRGTVRAHNEDSFVDRPELGLWAVADGAGGHQSGDLAAQIVAETLAAVPVREPKSVDEVLGIDEESRAVARDMAGRRSATCISAKRA